MKSSILGGVTQPRLLFTDVSGQHTWSSFKDQTVFDCLTLEDGAHRFSRNVRYWLPI